MIRLIERAIKRIDPAKMHPSTMTLNCAPWEFDSTISERAYVAYQMTARAERFGDAAAIAWLREYQNHDQDERRAARGQEDER